MQAHALTPRLVSALGFTSSQKPSSSSQMPTFPFLTLLVSGGHTLLLHSKSLTSHVQLATTVDIAIGDFIDKLARSILPQEILTSIPDANYGQLLEDFAFPDGTGKSVKVNYGYSPPLRRQEELARRTTKWGWGLTPPLSITDSGSKSKAMKFSFSGLGSTAQRVTKTGKSQGPGPFISDDGATDSDEPPRRREIGIEERRDLAQEGMRVAFEHLAGRILMALDKDSASMATADTENQQLLAPISTLVVSGGVAANKYLRHMYASILPHHLVAY